MKKLVLLSTVMCMVSSVSFGMDVKPYVEGKISENFMKVELNDSEGYSKDLKKNGLLGGSIEVGVKMDQFRVGLEGFWNDSMEKDIESPILKGEVESKGLFLNGYYDIKLPDNLKKVKPYVGGGIGYSWLKGTEKINTLGILPELDGNYTEKDKDFSWNVGLGVGYELNQNIDLTLGYRYENLGEIKSNGTTMELKNQKVSLGLRYTF